MNTNADVMKQSNGVFDEKHYKRNDDQCPHGLIYVNKLRVRQRVRSSQLEAHHHVPIFVLVEQSKLFHDSTLIQSSKPIMITSLFCAEHRIK